MEQSTDSASAPPMATLPLKTETESLPSKNAKSCEPSLVKVRKNNMTTRISAKPPIVHVTTRSSSSPSSEYRYDESSASSSFCTSTTPVSGTTGLVSERTEESSNISKPSYMNMTESTKAKQRRGSYASQRIQRQSMDDFHFLQKSGVISHGDSRSNAGSDHISRQLTRN